MPPVLQNIPFAAFPKLSAPLVDPLTGIIAEPYNRLLLALWQKSGGSNSNVNSSVYFVEDNVGIGAFNAISGNFLGYVILSGNPGGSPQVLTLNTNPFSYTATQSGTLSVPGGEIEWSRSGGPFRQVGVTGGTPRLLKDDTIRISWFGSGPPAPVVFYPDV